MCIHTHAHTCTKIPWFYWIIENQLTCALLFCWSLSVLLLLKTVLFHLVQYSSLSFFILLIIVVCVMRWGMPQRACGGERKTWEWTLLPPLCGFWEASPWLSHLAAGPWTHWASSPGCLLLFFSWLAVLSGLFNMILNDMIITLLAVWSAHPPQPFSHPWRRRSRCGWNGLSSNHVTGPPEVRPILRLSRHPTASSLE